MNVYEVVTNRILESLESGVIPWRKEWKSSAGGSIPTNYVTGKPYRGINVFALLCNEFSSNQWMTYIQPGASRWLSGSQRLEGNSDRLLEI